MPDEKIVIETFNELAQVLNVSYSWAKALWRRHGFKLNHRLGPRGRIRMTISELSKFKSKVNNESAEVKNG